MITSHFSCQPAELKRTIFENCSNTSLLKLSNVCKSFQEEAENLISKRCNLIKEKFVEIANRENAFATFHNQVFFQTDVTPLKKIICCLKRNSDDEATSFYNITNDNQLNDAQFISKMASNVARKIFTWDKNQDQDFPNFLIVFQHSNNQFYLKYEIKNKLDYKENLVDARDAEVANKFMETFDETGDIE